VQRAIGIPVISLFTAIFALARTVGWIAQLNEMIGDPEYKIGRPRQLFTSALIAASAVSKRLSDLETTLDTPLLYRHTRGVDLTPAGESLLHHARSVLFSLEKMQGELSEYADGVRGHVRVHASISAIVQFLPEDLGAFIRDHGGVKIDLEEHLSTEVVRAVREGAADLGICNASALTTAGASELQSLPYRQDQLVLIVPAGHPLSGRGALPFEDSLDPAPSTTSSGTNTSSTPKRTAPPCSTSTATWCTR
jgi:DNA-binding transcriptional LysR family regulator